MRVGEEKGGGGGGGGAGRRWALPVFFFFFLFFPFFVRPVHCRVCVRSQSPRWQRQVLWLAYRIMCNGDICRTIFRPIAGCCLPYSFRCLPAVYDCL